MWKFNMRQRVVVCFVRSFVRFVFFFGYSFVYLVNKSRKIWKQLYQEWLYVVVEKVLIMPKKEYSWCSSTSSGDGGVRWRRLVSYFNIRLEKNRRKCSTTRQFSQFFTQVIKPVSCIPTKPFKWITYSRRTKYRQRETENEIIIAVGPYMEKFARHNLFMCVAWSEANVPSREKLYPQITDRKTVEEKKK